MKVIPQPVKNSGFVERWIILSRSCQKIPPISHMSVSRILKAESGIPIIKAGRPQKLSELTNEKSYEKYLLEKQKMLF